MGNSLRLFVPCLLSLCIVSTVQGQQSEFSVDAYADFLASTEQLSSSELLDRYPSAKFWASIDDPATAPMYLDSVAMHYGLTQYENELLQQHGFVVTERFDQTSFGHALYDIYTRDLPVYISSDMILHAVHRAYSNLLQSLELGKLIPLLNTLLDGLRTDLVDYRNMSPPNDQLLQAIDDVDVYLTVAKHLLNTETAAPNWSHNDEVVQDILMRVHDQAKMSAPLFTEGCRHYDYSQFKPRGYYTTRPELSRYFQAMMWLGRTELYLSKPDTDDCQPSDADVVRQSLMSVIITELTSDNSDLLDAYNQIDHITASLVGASDNATVPNLKNLLDDADISTASDILEPETLLQFQSTVASSPLTQQKINAQILVSLKVRQTTPLRPAAAFLLLGQRFILDSYVLGHVVFSEIESKRMLPMSADMLFALGNNAAAEMLTEEIDLHDYGPNLAALRYLIDGFDDSYWDETFYSGWLNAIRQLNPPEVVSDRPSFMRTAAWWQKSMTTQLASWAQLRHDNLLYAKQSYSSSIGCVFPYVLVEPVPDFFHALTDFAAGMKEKLASFNTSQGEFFLNQLEDVSSTLADMAQNHIEGVRHTSDQMLFAQEMINEGGGSGPEFDGWYPSLFINSNAVTEEEVVVADIHTAPTNEYGIEVGWVKHIGTGPINLALITTDVPGVGPVTFTGPVMSFYEHTSTNFKRLTDEEWETVYALEPSIRPDFVNLYLADENGESRGTGFSLVTGLDSKDAPVEEQFSVANYPNPFSTSTTVTFSLPTSASAKPVSINVYDIQGRLVSKVELGNIPSGAYSTKWNPSSTLASGVYIVRVEAGEYRATNSMTLVR